MKLAPYPAYKPSGVKWLGDVPKSWAVQRSDAHVRHHKLPSISHDALAQQSVVHYSIPSVQEHGIGSIEDGTTIASSKLLVTHRVILVSRLNPRKSTIAMAEPDPRRTTVASVEFVALSPVGGDPRFLYFVLTSDWYRQYLDSRTRSVTKSHQRADPTCIRRFWYAWPSLKEQESIARFLDRKTAGTDELIKKAETLIERLTEMRLSLISRAVTPGYCSGGMEWLENLPEDWEVARMKYLVGLNDDKLPDTTEPDFEMAYINIGSVDAGGNVRPTPTSFEDAPSRARRLVKDGDTIVSTVRTYLRAIATIRDWTSGTAVASTGFAVLRPGSSVSAKYLGYLARSTYFVEAICARSFGVSYPAINPSDVATIRVPLPSRRKQRVIVDYLNHRVSVLDELTNRTKVLVERLKEMRQALITAAVTGKIDVRDTQGNPSE